MQGWEESGKFKGMNSTLGLISSFGNNGVIIMQEHRLDHVKLISSVQDFPWQICTNATISLIPD